MAPRSLVPAIAFAVTPSVELGERPLSTVHSVVSAPAILARPHHGVIATGEGYLFRRGVPMVETDYPRPNRIARLIGRNWPYLRRAYRQSLRSLARAERCDSGWWVSDVKSGNYYHWFCDAAPKLALIARADRAAPVLVPEVLASLGYVRMTLELLGLSDVRVVPRGRALKPETLWTIDRVGYPGLPHPAVHHGLGEALRAALGVAERPGERRLWISRRQAAMRRIANEDDLAPVLARHGFEIVSMEALGPHDQARLVASAAIIAGPHGAGLTNMLFMPTGGRVLEVRVSGNPDCFVYEASALGHRHFSLEGGVAPSARSHSADMTVTPEALDRALAAVTAPA